MRILNYIDNLSEWSGRVIMWLPILLTVVVSYDVIARYFFSSPTSWAFEVSWMLFSLHFMWGLAYTHRHHKNVRVDILFNRFSQRVKAILEIIFYIIIIFPFCAVVIKFSMDYAWASWEMKQHSTQTLFAPPLYPFKMLIPIAFSFLGLQVVAEFIRNIIIVIKGK